MFIKKDKDKKKPPPKNKDDVKLITPPKAKL